ncbi:MAG TPA: hypothetical protein VEK08_26525 [Planctomycetota bacterium]|nr:hypothetical protein [Planctomycetota bacterium]
MRVFRLLPLFAAVLTLSVAMAADDEIPKTSRNGTSAGDLERQANGTSSRRSNDERSLGAQAGHYFLSRFYDLVDIVDFSVGAGPGFMVNVRATKLAQAMGGWGDAYHVGFRGRSAGVWREKRKEVGVSLLYYQKVQRERITGWVESFRSEKMDLDTSAVYANNNDRSFLGVGATIQAGVMVNVNVRPMQAIDFVLGWMTIDVLDDDTGKPRRNKDL